MIANERLNVPRMEYADKSLGTSQDTMKTQRETAAAVLFCFILLHVSGRRVFLMKYPIMTGTRVTARIAEAAMEYVLVKARGRNSLPSCAWSVKIGKKEKVIISKEKKSAGPTCFAAIVIIAQWSEEPSFF
jgi:hypothetical protein